MLQQQYAMAAYGNQYQMDQFGQPLTMATAYQQMSSMAPQAAAATAMYSNPAAWMTTAYPGMMQQQAGAVGSGQSGQASANQSSGGGQRTTTPGQDAQSTF